MRGFLRETKGAVNIFLIVVFTAIFLFNAVFIDYARILVAKKQTESVLRTAVRSVLSTYDQSLKEEYGLFGTNVGNEKLELFHHVISKNLSLEEGDFNFANVVVDPSTTFIEGKYPLANHRVFEEQILENMKYNGPIHLTVEIIDRFKNMSVVLEEADELTTTLSNLEEEYYKRENNLNQAIQNQLSAASLVREGISNRSIRSTHQKYLLDAINNITQAKVTNDRMKQLLNQRKINTPSDHQEEVKQLRVITKDAEELMVIASSFFDDFQGEVSGQTNQLGQIVKVEEEYDIFLKEANALDGQLPAELKLNLEEKNRELTRELKAYKSLYVHSNNQIEQRKKAIESVSNRLDKKTKEKHEKETMEGLKTFNKVMETIRELKNQTENMNQVIDRTNFYLTYNEEEAEGQPNPSLGSNQKAAKQALTEVKSIFSTLSSILEDSRDQMLVNEYAFSHFKSFDPSKLRLLEGDTSLNVDKDKLLSLLDIENQEVEFIIYGDEDLGGNISRALLDIFMIRLALHTTEGFFDPKVRALGHPLAILAGAIAYGVNHALADMIKLLKGEEISFSNRFLKVSLGYYEHLRFLFILHNQGSTGNKNKLSRMQGIIDFNTGLDLTSQFTYGMGHATTSLDLWFLPGVFKTLELGNVIDDKISGRRYIFSNMIGMDY